MTAPKPITPVHPVTKQVFQLMESEGMMLKTLAWKVGYDAGWLSRVKLGRRRTEPSLTALTNLAAVFGHEVVIVPKATAAEIRKQFDEKLPR